MLSPRTLEDVTNNGGRASSYRENSTLSRGYHTVGKPPRDPRDPRTSIDQVRAKQQALEHAADEKRRERRENAQRTVQEQNAELKKRQLQAVANREKDVGEARESMESFAKRSRDSSRGARDGGEERRKRGAFLGKLTQRSEVREESTSLNLES